MKTLEGTAGSISSSNSAAEYYQNSQDSVWKILGPRGSRWEIIPTRPLLINICHLSQDHFGVDKVWAGIEWRLPCWLRHDHWWESRGEFEQNRRERKETNWEVLRLLRRKYNSVSISCSICKSDCFHSFGFLSFPQLQIIATMSANWIKTLLYDSYICFYF